MAVKKEHYQDDSENIFDYKEMGVFRTARW